MESRPTQTPIVLQSIKLVCPRCGLTRPYSFAAPQAAHNLNCQLCLAPFTARLVQIRATHSPISDGQQRELSVEVVDSLGAVGRVPLTLPQIAALKLRPADLAVFIYSHGRLVKVQNLSLQETISL